MVEEVEAKAAARIARAWDAIARVEDPEIPVISIVDLGIVRYIEAGRDRALEVGLSPTYTGCPATEVIRRLVESALREADVGDFAVKTVLAPAWSSDWITPGGRRKLLAYGIVPPENSVAFREWRHVGGPVACPRCRSVETEVLSEFGSTPCKALHRCNACLEPFDYFKCI
ncbi:MAG: phenylacetate-CoA oxygenase subunit PaaJ [Pseudomonadota bacterium]|nr:phenylacetate-CoA oxygenase subunit PaaJ [Pseudomonadota bacterium]